MSGLAPCEAVVDSKPPHSFRVLAFEDNTNIGDLLREGGIITGEFLQKWTTDDAVAVVAEFAPDVLLLDHYIPPLNGLQVLQAVLAAVKANRLERPSYIIAMSSQASKNVRMVEAGADAGFVKWDVPQWTVWGRR